MDIFRSFEVFLAEPLSVLKDRIVQIVGISTGTNMRPEVNAELLKQKTQITVLNSTKMYNLLKRINSKQENLKRNSITRKLLTNETEKNQSQAIFGQLTLRL